MGRRENRDYEYLTIVLGLHRFIALNLIRLRAKYLRGEFDDKRLEPA